MFRKRKAPSTGPSLIDNDDGDKPNKDERRPSKLTRDDEQEEDDEDIIVIDRSKLKAKSRVALGDTRRVNNIDSVDETAQQDGEGSYTAEVMARLKEATRIKAEEIANQAEAANALSKEEILSGEEAQRLLDEEGAKDDV